MTEVGSLGGLTALTDGYLLRDANTQTVYVAVTNVALRPGGVMPHLAPGAGVEIAETHDDGSLSIVIRHQQGTTQMDEQLRAYPVPEPLAAELVAAAGVQ